MKINTIKISYRTVCLLAVIGFVSAGAGPGWAQLMPQDNWYFIRAWGEQGGGVNQLNNPHGITVGSNGLVYVADRYNQRIQVFLPDGTHTQTWDAAGNNVMEISEGPNGCFYVITQAGPGDKVLVFAPDGTITNQWGSRGSDTNQFNDAYGIDVSDDGRVYVADTDNNRVQVFDLDGAFLTTWGKTGTAAGEFINPQCVAVDQKGLVYVGEGVGGNRRLQVFEPDGTYVREWGMYFYVQAADVGADGLVYLVTDSGCRVEVFEPEGVNLRGWPFGEGAAVRSFGVACAADGTVYLSRVYEADVLAYGRARRTIGGVPPNAVCQPRVVSAVQRPGTTFVDIDYVVSDPDSTNVHTAVLAFVDGNNDLGSAMSLKTLMEGTSTNLGSGMEVGKEYRITWDASADWNADFGQMEFEVLTRDNSKLMDFHFITIPSNGPNPQLTISRSPVVDSDFLSCWYWLIATNDTAINLVSGKVFGTSGPYTGLLLADSTTTTTNGRAFLFERMNVQEASAAQLARARMGLTPGTTNVWDPRIPVGPAGGIVRPKKVNECGFDTGNWGADAWWVVPLD